MSQIPVPEVFNVVQTRLSRLSDECTDAAHQRFDTQAAVRHRILDLATGRQRKLTGRLNDWHELDFSAFQAEVKKAFRADIPLRQRADWESYLAENAAEVRSLTTAIATAEREIDEIVYDLFDLTSDEVALLEAALAGRR